MSDVLFRNLDQVPLQEEFTPSSVFKISSASKVAALVIGIISICVFTLTDNAKASITTISSKNVDGQCTMLSSFSGTLARSTTTVTADVAKSFNDGFFTLLKDATGMTKNTYTNDLLGGRPQRVNDFLQASSDSVSLFQVYFPTYQSCMDEFSKPPVCSYMQESGRAGNYDQPFMFYGQFGNIPLKNFCQSSLKCSWPEILRTDEWESWNVYMNVTNFNCAPSANFTSCELISSKCPEYTKFAAGFAKLFRQIHPAEQMCQTFKSNPPYSCLSFQVVSPIQVIAQTLSLMATALGGSELFLYAMLKYRRVFTRSTPVASTVTAEEAGPATHVPPESALTRSPDSAPSDGKTATEMV